MQFKAFIRSPRDADRWVATDGNREILASALEDVIYATTWDEARTEFEGRFPLPPAYRPHQAVLSTVALRQTKGYYGPADSVVLHPQVPLWSSTRLDLNQLQRIVDTAGPVRLVKLADADYGELVERFTLEDDYITLGGSPSLVLSRDPDAARRQRVAARGRTLRRAISVSDLKDLSYWLACELPISVEHGCVDRQGAAVQLARVLNPS